MPRLAMISVSLMGVVPNVVLKSPSGDYEQGPGVIHVGIEPPAVVGPNGGPVTAPIALYRINATQVDNGAPVVLEGARFIGQSAVTEVYRFSIN